MQLLEILVVKGIPHSSYTFIHKDTIMYTL